METITRIDELRKWIAQLFWAIGLETEASICTAEALVKASLRGVDSHGIRLLTHYMREIEEGRIEKKAKMKWKKTSPSIGVLDAAHGSAYLAGQKAMNGAIKLAHHAGTGWVSVKNSNHCGMMAYYALMACKFDMIGFAITHAAPRAAHPNCSKHLFFGTNPICYAVPMYGEGPLCYDAATTQITFNNVKLCIQKKRRLSKNVAVDSQGIMTRDPLKAKALLPFGGYKGFGLMMMVDIFSGLLSGMPVGTDVTEMYSPALSNPRKLGHFFGALRIESFINPHRFKKQLYHLVTRMRNMSDHIVVPGDIEKLNEAKREKEGIPISKETRMEINRLSRRYAVPCSSLFNT